MSSTKIKHFINLTNGIEALEKYNLQLEDVAFIRIQSCHCERSKYVEILGELDYNFLMYLAMGFHCKVYDFGANCETSKAIYLGLEWVNYVLNRRWFDRIIPVEIKGWDLAERFDMFYRRIDFKTKRKLDYFKKFLACEEISYQAISSATSNDNKLDFFRERILSAIEAVGDM